jgi:hypothetical protein
MPTFQGRCHCSAVRFEIDALIERVTFCNCSLCARTGYLHIYVPPERFRLHAGSEAALTTYSWGTGTARHQFCKHCGISAFRRPRSDPHVYDVNVRCLEGLDVDSLPVDRFDGQDWERAAEARQLEGLRKMAETE